MTRMSIAVTFEFEHLPPKTHRCVVEGAAVDTCVARAIRMARKALKPQGWTSACVVVLERGLSAANELVRDAQTEVRA